MTTHEGAQHKEIWHPVFLFDYLDYLLTSRIKRLYAIVDAWAWVLVPLLAAELFVVVLLMLEPYFLRTVFFLFSL